MGCRYAKIPDAEREAMSNEQIRERLTPAQLERLDMELGVLDNMGYNGYFLIVQDFINWGKSVALSLGQDAGRRRVRLLRLRSISPTLIR